MREKAVALLLVAWALFAPFAAAAGCSSTGAGSSCCAHMACCGHCDCQPGQSCHAVKPPVTDPQLVAERIDLSPRIDLVLFALDFDRASLLAATPFSRPPEPRPPETSPPSQSRLCLWLI